MPFRRAIKLFAIPPAHARGTKIEVLFEKQAVQPFTNPAATGLATTLEPMMMTS
jgi:hypothetical protein